MERDGRQMRSGQQKTKTKDVLISEKAVLAAKVSKGRVFNQKQLGELDKLLGDEDVKTHIWENSTSCFVTRMKRPTIWRIRQDAS